MNYLLSILLTSIIAVESGEGLGSTDIDSVGGDGRAVGMLHITPAMVMDVNLITGKHYKLADRLDRMASIEMYTVYLTHYGNVYRKHTGEEPTLEVYARIWNGGPDGYNDIATLGYWNKVKAELESRGIDARLGRPKRPPCPCGREPRR